MKVRENISGNTGTFKKLNVPINTPKTVYPKIAWLLGILMLVLFLAFTIASYLRRTQ